MLQIMEKINPVNFKYIVWYSFLHSVLIPYNIYSKTNIQIRFDEYPIKEWDGSQFQIKSYLKSCFRS